MERNMKVFSLKREARGIVELQSKDNWWFLRFNVYQVHGNGSYETRITRAGGIQTRITGTKQNDDGMTVVV